MDHCILCPAPERVVVWQPKRLCLLQEEYSTAPVGTANRSGTPISIVKHSEQFCVSVLSQLHILIVSLFPFESWADPRLSPKALMYGERTQLLLKTRGMLGRASNSLGLGPWELPSSPLRL